MKRKEKARSSLRTQLPTSATVKRALLVVATFAAMIMLWQVILTVFNVPKWLIPTPYDIYLSYVTSGYRNLLPNALVTLVEVLLGFGAGVGIGILMGITVFYSGFIRNIVYPLAIFVKVIPIVAIAPLLTIWFGFGMTSKVAISALIVFFPVLVNTLLGLGSVDTSMVDLLHSLSASGHQIFIKVRLVWALPHIFSALKISITSAVIGAIIGEFVGASSGLGSMILISQSYLDTPLMFLMLVALAIMGIVLFEIIVLAEKMLVPWAEAVETKT